MYQLNVFFVLEALTVVLCLAGAVLLFRLSISGTTARLLAWLLVVEAITLFSSGVFLGVFSPEYLQNFWRLAESEPESWQANAYKITFTIHTAGDCAMLALYPPFLASAIKSKLTRPFGTQRGRVVAATLALLLFIAVLTTPLEVGALLLYASLSLLFGYALIAAIHGWKIAPPGNEKTRAGVFTLAFGVRDLVWGFIYGSAIYMILIGIYGTHEDPEWRFHLYRLSTLVYVPVLAYGILRTKLFDIDLKLRWTLKQFAFATMVVIITFAISEGLESLVAAELGDSWGLVAAAVAVLLLKPLQNFAERIVSAIMPNTLNTDDYKSTRKVLVYEAAFEEAWEECGVSEKERALLNRLRDSLELSQSVAEAIEKRIRLEGSDQPALS